ncbi:MAG: beta-N-acetylhexosaminidase [Acidobacteriota bacterium]
MSPSGLRRQIGQCVMLGFSGPSVPPELRSLARDFDLGGVVLFSRNVEEPEQIAELSAECARLSDDPPLWVGIDQEGGRVARLRGAFTRWPAAHVLGRSGSDALVRRFAAALAREMRAVGITLNFAPVLDVLSNPRNAVIGDRAFGADAAMVARLSAAFIEAFQAEGVAACGKHFPGHGDTFADSHVEVPVVEHGPDRLRSVEYLPFRAAVEAGVSAMMTSHLLVPALDETWPASQSAAITRGELRERLGFRGVVLTDDLCMKACSARWDVPSAAVRAVVAGHDAVLVCEPQPDLQAATLEALVHAVEDGTVPYSRVEEAIVRHRSAKAAFCAREPQSRAHDWRIVVGCDAHRAVADEMAAFL